MGREKINRAKWCGSQGIRHENTVGTICLLGREEAEPLGFPFLNNVTRATFVSNGATNHSCIVYIGKFFVLLIDQIAEA